MSLSRRTLLHRSATIAAVGGTLAVIPRPLMAAVRGYPEAVPPIEDPDLKKLTDLSLEAARKAGASYADARLTHTYTRNPFRDTESIMFGVRALVDGYWGFASSPIWSPDEAARLGQAAAVHARANALGQVREVNFAPVSSSAGEPDSGHWTTPVKDDPFTMSPDEIVDYFEGISLLIQTLPDCRPKGGIYEFVKQDKAYASTEGQYCTQRLYRSGAEIGVTVGGIDIMLGTVSPAGMGLEHIRDQNIHEQILAAVEEVREDMKLPPQVPDVGRFDTVLDAQTVAYLMRGSIGLATELDRAMGYEANASGTSYIMDPAAMLGTLKVGSALIDVTANRSEPGGVATVQWDDEGVRPKTVPIIEKGILGGMQTNREGAGWIREYYESRKEPMTSSGCSYASDAYFPPSIRSGNLTLAPSKTQDTFDSLISGMSKGLAFKRSSSNLDFQQMTGMLRGNAFEVRNGKRVSRVPLAGLIFRTSEIWNAATALGGAASAQRFGIRDDKGEPKQESFYSVTAVPMSFKELTVIDISRKA